MEELRIKIIGVPFSYGQEIKGVEKAYDYLFDNHLLNIGNCTKLLYVDKSPKEYTKNNIHYYNEVLAVNNLLSVKVMETLNNQEFPIVIGGDHAVSIGSISAVSNYYGVDNLSVVYLDAHLDIHLPTTSVSKNAHGMPLRFLLGEGPTELTTILNDQPKIKAENLLYLGTRDYEGAEFDYVMENHIKYLKAGDFYQEDFQEKLVALLDSINTPYVHISIDIDFLDKDIFRATDVPSSFPGPNIEHLYRVLEQLFLKHQVVAIDLVEYNPDLNKENDTVIVKDLIEYLIKKLTT